ncbi:MAG: 2'-5' RNA ligase [Myxococcota bacterium]|jgi:2'-5' RNA ligase
MTRKSADGIVTTRRKRREPPEPKVRVFAALPLDDATRSAIDAAIEEPRARLGAFNWVERGNWHITLKYFGDVPRGAIPALRTALTQSVSGATFSCAVRGMGGFPNLREPKVLWVGVKSLDGRLAALQRAINDGCQKLGYELDMRRFAPHITVARARAEHAHPVAREITPVMDAAIAEATFEEVILFESYRVESNADARGTRERMMRYQPIHRVRLTPKES